MSHTIWHNQSCSTSRKILNFLESKPVEVTIRNYITYPPTIDELKDIVTKMNGDIQEIIRKKDKVFIELFKDKKLTDAQWYQALSENPSMIERPIVTNGVKSWLARPADTFIANFI
jgi:arsenate reductase (glutaredoxin)